MCVSPMMVSTYHHSLSLEQTKRFHYTNIEQLLLTFTITHLSSQHILHIHNSLVLFTQFMVYANATSIYILS